MKTLAILVSALVLMAPAVPCAAAPTLSTTMEKQVDRTFQPRYATLNESVTSEGLTLRAGTSVLINVRYEGTNSYGFTKNGRAFRVDRNQFSWQ